MNNRQTHRPLRAILLGLILVAFAAITVVVFGPAIANMFVLPSERYRQEGDAFATDNRLPEAVLSYRQVVEANPKDRLAASALAQVYAAQGRQRMAARYLNMSGTVSPLPTPPSGALSLLWMANPTESVPTGATLQGDRFVVAYENGLVALFNAQNGQKGWSVTLSDGISAAPTVAATAGNGYAQILIGAMDGTLYALSSQDGSTLWKFNTGGPIYAAPLVSAGTVYCPSGDGSLYALKLADGTLLWKVTRSGQLHATPELSGNTLYFGSTDGKLYAINTNNREPLWKNGLETNAAMESQPLAANGRLIFGSGDGRVYAVAPETGGLYWRFSTPDAIYARPMVIDQTVYIASSGHTLSAVDFLSGQKIWQADFETMLREPPAAQGDRLYQAADADPNLYVLDRLTGKVLDKIPTGDWIAGGPWLDKNNLYLLGKDGAVLAFRLAR